MPTLYIGLGGTGLETLKRLKKRFDYEGIRDEKEIQYIGVDIGGADNDAREGINDVSIVFREGSVKSIIDDDRDWNQIDDWWFDRTDNPNLSFGEQGAYQVRKYGRLAFYRNGNENRSPLIDRIKRAIDRLSRQGIRFVIMASVSGGTGAGIFAEIPGIIKALRKDSPDADKDKIYGFLIMHDVVEHLYGIQSQNEKDAVAKNAICLLTELDLIELYHQSYPISFKIKNGDSYILRPYDFIALTGHVNESHHKMDEKEDYFALQSFGAWLFHALHGKVSAIENITLGPVTAPFATTKFTISNKDNRRTEYEIPATFPRKYLSFGVVVLDIEEEKIKSYLFGKIVSQIENELLEISKKSSYDIKKNEDKLNGLLLPCKESEGANNLTNHVYGIISDIAKSTRQNFLVKANKNVLIDNITKNILGSTDVYKLINEYKGGVELVFNHENFLSAFINKLELVLDNVYNDIIGPSGLGSRDLTLTGKVEVLAIILKIIQTEKSFVDSKKLPWVTSRNINAIEDKIKKSAEKYVNYKPGVFTSFNKKKAAEARKAYAEDIAKEIILEYFEFQLLSRIIQPIKSFYDKLSDQLSNTLMNLKKDHEDILKYCDSQPEFLESIQPSKGGKTLIDFHVKLANTRTIFDKYALKEDDLKSYISPEKVSNISKWDQIEALAREISEGILENHITIDNTLRWEAMYFLNDWPIAIEQGDTKIVHYNGLIDLYRKASPADFTVFLNGVAKDYFDINIIKSVRFKNFLKNDINEDNQTAIFEALIEARLKCILDHLYFPFISKSGRMNEFVDNRNGKPLVSNYKTTLLVHEDNKLLMKTIDSINRHKDRTIKVEVFEGSLYTKTSAHIMVFEVGFPLIESEALCALQSKESERFEANLKYFNGDEHVSMHHNDKRYAIIPKYLSYSPFLWLDKGQDHVVNPWKLFLLLMAQDCIEAKDKTSPVLIKSPIGSDTNTLIRKDAQFDDPNTLYMLLLNCNDAAIRDLVKQYEYSLKEKEDGKESLMEAFESFKEKEYATALNLVMKDYVESLFE